MLEVDEVGRGEAAVGVKGCEVGMDENELAAGEVRCRGGEGGGGTIRDEGRGVSGGEALRESKRGREEAEEWEWARVRLGGGGKGGREVEVGVGGMQLNRDNLR